MSACLNELLWQNESLETPCQSLHSVVVAAGGEICQPKKSKFLGTTDLP